MTIINNIEIDNIEYIPDDIKHSIEYNQPIENKLHMIICISNPCQYARRYILAREFKKRIEQNEKNVILYIVELAYHLPGKNPQKFYITEKGNPRHLQLFTDTAPLWHKENMWNLGIQLLPKNWKAVAFCDADISFENPHFAIDTLKILNGTRDIVHMHSHCLDLNLNLDIMSVFNSFGFQYTRERPYCHTGKNFFHPGYNIAMTRKAYEQIGGIYELSILGSGDRNFLFCLVNNGIKSINENASDMYKKSIIEFEKKCVGLKLGYVHGVIFHYFHGSKKNRKYTERWEILIKHQYDPYKHMTKNKDGLIIPSKECPQEMLDDIMEYFSQRNEDNNLPDLSTSELSSDLEVVMAALAI